MVLSKLIHAIPVATTIALTIASLVMTCSIASGQSPLQRDAEAISFNRDVRPILSDKCFHCHGPDANSRETDLRFDNKESALADLGGYAAIVPGDADASEMMVRILEEDPDMKMPPEHIHKPLSDREVATLKAWIEQGANWDEFWAYVPPKRHPIPKATGDPEEVSRNWIDRMVADRLAKNGFEMSPPADRVTLLRRLYFDLIGLPPTPEQVDAFMRDSSADAYDQQVQQLLESKHFGERLATYWLDLVRYADTVGYHGDQDQNISPYRDWVINSFNDNLPFDQFTREQLAGDLLPNPTMNQKIASGYNRLLQTTHEGGLQPKEYSAIYAADRVRNVSAVWMGATVGCAQCHDHKYDPYTAKDFYSMAAFFADIDDEKHFKDGTNSLPTRRSPELLVIDDAKRKKLDEQQQRIGQQRNQLDKLKKRLAQAKAKAKKEAKGKDEAATRDADSKKPTTCDMTTPSDDAIQQLEQSIAESQRQLKSLQQAAKQIESLGRWTMISQPLKTPRTVRVLPRGNWMDESGPSVNPAIPEFMGVVPAAGQRATRLDLANWLTAGDSDSGKLTARVFANRIWYLFMGVGISKSLDDFGGQGEPPAFPELLDNLALEFAADWDIKKLIKQIVTSQTYQQTSVRTDRLLEIDPLNQLFGRQSRYRLPAETIRDNALAISGLLNVDSIGGRSVKPYQPAHYYRHLNFPPRKYKHDTNAQQWRRGVYVHWQRQFLHPSLKALDAPSREECTCERSRSNTPLAALSLLNDPCFVEAARVFAHRIMNEADPATTGERINFAFRWAVSRSPSERETRLLSELFQQELASFRKSADATKKLLATGQAPVDKTLDASELAAWTSVARVILNMSETISRN